MIEKYDSAIILPIEGDQVYLVEQFRYPIGEKSLEFPQGSLERNDVDPAEIARDELQAETGLVAERLEYLGENPYRLRLCQPEDVCVSRYRIASRQRATATSKSTTWPSAR